MGSIPEAAFTATLWPMLVEAGFEPLSQIKVKSIKFALTLFAVAHKNTLFPS